MAAQDYVVDSDVVLYDDISFFSGTGYPLDFSGPSLESVLSNLIDIHGYDDPVYWVWARSGPSVSEASSFYVMIADFSDGFRYYTRPGSIVHSMTFNTFRCYTLSFSYSSSSSRNAYTISPFSFSFGVADLGSSYEFSLGYDSFDYVGFYPNYFSQSFRFGSFNSGMSGIALIYGNVGIAVPSADVSTWYFYRIGVDPRPSVICGVPLSDFYSSSGGVDYAQVIAFGLSICFVLFGLFRIFDSMRSRLRA